MAGQSDYLPPGLPLNRAKWPPECQLMEHYDMRAAALIKQLYERKFRALPLISNSVKRRRATGIFRARLNYWRDEKEKGEK
jgi:hypothetical protein